MRTRPLPLSQLKMTDRFWSRWQRVVRDRSLPHQYRQIVETGRLEHFRSVARGETGTFKGFYFNDSDVYKWLEAAAYALILGENAELRAMIEEAVAAVQGAQLEDGYLNTFITLNHPDLRWRNLGAMHEMYCGGHLLEAGVAMFECLGDRRMLDVSIRFADLIAATFGPGKRKGYCGHEELELALVKLTRATGNPKYRELAKWMVEERGSRPSPFEAELEDVEAQKMSPWRSALLDKDGKYNGEYAQDHAPIREHDAVVGHAVRAMYLYIAAADLVTDPAAMKAQERAWKSLSSRRMYITGGIGPSRHNEGFTEDFDLPNLSAYAETCAACGLAWWGQKLVEATGVSDYADVVERALYNGVLSGISLDGESFFYDNPLESRGQHARTPWFGCACCPPNVARLIGSVGNLVASQSDSAFYLHIPASFVATTELNGVKTRITVEGNYPWSGQVKVTVDPERPVEFAFAVRIPGWADDLQIELGDDNETAAEADGSEYETGYAVYRRVWSPGDVIKLDFEMGPKWIEANPRVLDDLGRIAMTRGPLVYCLEDKDVEFVPQRFAADADSEPISEERATLEGHVAVVVPGVVEGQDFPDDLYADLDTTPLETTEATLIPYYLWNNRGPSHMQVWLRRM